MNLGRAQYQRLMELLDRVDRRDAGESVPSRGIAPVLAFNSQEQTDATTLFYMGWIRGQRGWEQGPANSWSSEGIYAYALTGDGRAVLGEWREQQKGDVGESPTGIEVDDAPPSTRSRPFVMM